MVDLVPELKLIIGEQPPVPALPPQDAQGRFQLVFRRFIGVFARPEHPLALFLDDLQWLDAATLDLLEDLLARPDVQHLILIGAYRDNERLDMNEAIEEVVILTQSEMRRNKVASRMELAANLPPVMGDRVQLQQVVVNLILNAIEAMSKVEGRARDLVIRTQRGEADEVRVAVQDSGIGLDPKKRATNL
jgi:signal transduction histidine kinase